MLWLFPLFAFTFGAIVGTFLNVVIHRDPREESIVFPPATARTATRPSSRTTTSRSSLPLAPRPLPRVPRTDQRPLSPVELANGALLPGALPAHGHVTPGFLPLAALVSMTLALIYIDLEIQILPDVIDSPASPSDC